MACAIADCGAGASRSKPIRCRRRSAILERARRGLAQRRAEHSGVSARVRHGRQPCHHEHAVSAIDDGEGWQPRCATSPSARNETSHPPSRLLDSLTGWRTGAASSERLQARDHRAGQTGQRLAILFLDPTASRASTTPSATLPGRPAAGGGRAPACDHPPGDFVSHGADRMRRPNSFRLGGDEFTTLLPTIPDRGCAGDRRAHPHRDERSIRDRGPGAAITTSVGIAVHPGRRRRRRHADQARRHRDVRRQGQRAQWLPLLQPCADRRRRCTAWNSRPACAARSRSTRSC